MHSVFVIAPLLVIVSSSWSIFALGKGNENNFDYKFEENLAEENDLNGLDDRETGLKNRYPGKREFDEDYREKTDDDLFFSQDEDEFEKRER